MLRESNSGFFPTFLYKSLRTAVQNCNFPYLSSVDCPFKFGLPPFCLLASGPNFFGLLPPSWSPTEEEEEAKMDSSGGSSGGNRASLLHTLFTMAECGCGAECGVTPHPLRKIN